jgi:hypothetical protein
MKMKKLKTYKIDLKKISEAFNLKVEQTFDFFNDGRIMGRLGEFIHSSSDGGLRQNENSSFDIFESNEKKSEIRSITDKVSFASSKEIGYGRNVTEEGFEKKLQSLDRYVLLDLRKLNEGIFDTIEVTKEDLTELKLGKNKSISAKKFYEHYDRIK